MKKYSVCYYKNGKRVSVESDIDSWEDCKRALREHSGTHKLYSYTYYTKDYSYSYGRSKYKNTYWRNRRDDFLG